MDPQSLIESKIHLKTLLLASKKINVEKMVKELSKTYEPLDIAEELISSVLRDIGESWEKGTASLSQLYVSSRICESVIDQLLPAAAHTRLDQPKMGICSLEDYHLLGQRMVYSVVRARGYELKDYGRLTVPEIFQKVKDDDLDIIMVSVLMLRSALKVKALRQMLDDQGVKVMVAVGGAPFLFDEMLWKDVSADAFGRNAAEAVRIAEIAGKVRE